MGAAPPPRPDATPAAGTAEGGLIALYGWGHLELLRGAWTILADTPHTLAGSQAAVGPLRRLTARVTATLQVRTDPLVQAMVDGYATAGERLADAEHAAAGQRPPVDGGEYRAWRMTDPSGPSGVQPGGGQPPTPPPPGTAVEATDDGDLFNLSLPHGERAADAIRRDLTSSLANVRERITRFPDDVYKATAPHGAIAQVLDNGWTPHTSKAAAWRAFLAQGVTGFTDRAGRRWNLATYTQMAVRTAALRAFNDSQLQRGRVLGARFFTVPPHKTACPLCWPWEGKVLSDGLQPVEPGTPVAGTIAEATAAGLFHPNCRHSLSAYYPGVSEPPLARPPWGEAEQQQYDDSQRQRAYERAIRQAKVEAQYALNDAEAKRARRRIRALQGRLRELVNSREYLDRWSEREQPDLAYARVRLPGVDI